MKCLNKILAAVLSCIIILNTSSIAYASSTVTSSKEIQEYIVDVSSNEYDHSDVTFYKQNKKYYLSLGDIKKFTRYELNETDTTIILTQGVREVVIDKNTGHLVDSGLVDQGNIDIIQYNGEFLCEGIPMLKYLGAACTLRNDKILEVMMPPITIWESIMPDYLDYYFDLEKLYGGEKNIKISLACDIIADVLDGVSGHGLFADGDTHLEDALYEILDVDVMKYDSVREFAAEQNQKINDFLSSDVFKTILDTGANTYGAVYEALNYYSKFYISAENDVLLTMMTQTGDLDYASELASQIKEQVYAQAVAKANLNYAKQAGSFIDVGMLAFDTAVTSYSMMQYDDDTRNLFARVINPNMLEYANYYDISWNNVSDKISKTLTNTKSIVANTAIENVVKFAIEKVTEKSAESALLAFTSKANVYVSAAQIGTFVASLINYKTNQAFSADMNAIWLNTVQYDIAQLTSRMLLKERDEYHLSDQESLKKLKDIFTLYYRTIIAFSENMAVSVDRFGGKNKNEWVQYFGGTSGKSVCNYAAIYLYRITNCTIVPIVDYQKLTDNVLSSGWVERFKQEQADIELPSYYQAVGNVHRGESNIQLNADHTFTCTLKDYDWGDQGDDYPNGTCYISQFEGKFSKITTIDEFRLKLTVEYIEQTNQPGDQYIQDGMRFIVEEDDTLAQLKECRMYLPGTPFEFTDDCFATLDGGEKMFYIGPYYGDLQELMAGRFALELDENMLIFLGELESDGSQELENGYDASNLVSDAYSDYVPNNLYNTEGYFYIPKVNADLPEIEETNAKIYDDYYNYMQTHVYGPIEAGSNTPIDEISYIWEVKDQYLSILMYVMWAGKPSCEVYTVSLETGALVENSELLTAYGITEEGFNELVGQASQKIGDSLRWPIPYVNPETKDLCAVGGSDKWMYDKLVNLTGTTEPFYPWEIPAPERVAEALAGAE